MILHRVSFRSKKYRATVFWVRKFVCQRGFDSKLGIGQSWVKTYCTCNISDINLTFYNVLFVCFFFRFFLFSLWCENIQASEDHLESKSNLWPPKQKNGKTKLLSYLRERRFTCRNIEDRLMYFYSRGLLFDLHRKSQNWHSYSSL